ncbi:MAG: hypothetical protein ACLP7F_16470 [Acidimicrobiales bacterium]
MRPGSRLHRLSWATSLVAVWALGLASAAPATRESTVISVSSAGTGTVRHQLDGESEAPSAPAQVTARVSEAPLPGNAGASTPNAVSCWAPDDCTAAGNYEIWAGSYAVYLATVEAEKDGTWGPVHVVEGAKGVKTEQDAQMNGISCPSAGDCTAVGQYYDGTDTLQAMAATETAGIWEPAVEVQVPGEPIEATGTLPGAQEAQSKGILSSVSCPSAGNCTAVGFYVPSPGTLEAIVATEVSGTWAPVMPVGSPKGAAPGASDTLGSVSCPSAGNCTAVGKYVGSPFTTYAMAITETAGRWAPPKEVATPPGPSDYVDLDNVSCSSAGNCTAIGGYDGGRCCDSTAELYHIMLVTERAGSWGAASDLVLLPANATPMTVASNLNQVASLSCSSTGNCTLAGGYPDQGGTTQAMVAVERAGTWARASKVTPPANVFPETQCPFQDSPGRGSCAWVAYFASISCPSATSCTAVGQYVDSSGSPVAMVATLTWSPVEPPS